MQIDRYRCWAALLLLAGAAGCAGNGQGLDQDGQPSSPGTTASGPITADLQSIQENVFTPICSVCHQGASAPEGLQLDAAHSYNMLVGMPSVEQPNLLRVKPGDPDDSYMVHKIEGLPGIDGGQMPLGETPLPQATIDAIRQWITNGAPNTPAAAAAAAAQLFAVQSTVPLDGAIVQSAPARIAVTFTQEVDASLVNGTTVALQRMGGADSAESGAERVPATAALAPHNAAVLLISPSATLAPGVYRVSVRGTGAAALANLSAAILGADTSFEFTVEPPR